MKVLFCCYSFEEEQNVIMGTSRNVVGILDKKLECNLSDIPTCQNMAHGRFIVGAAHKSRLMRSRWLDWQTFTCEFESHQVSHTFGFSS